MHVRLRLLGVATAAAALVPASAARTAPTVVVAEPDRAAAAAVPVSGGTAVERRAVRTALAHLGGRVRIRWIAIRPAPAGVGRGAEIAVGIGRPPGRRAFRITRYEAGWQAQLVAGETLRLLPPADRRRLRWLEIENEGGSTLRGREGTGNQPSTSEAGRIAAETAAAVEAAGFTSVHVRALPIDGVALRVDARATEAQLARPQRLQIAWGDRSISRLRIFRRPDGTPYEAAWGSRALSAGSWWSGAYAPGSGMPVPAPWNGPLVLRAVATRTVIDRTGPRAVRVVRNLTCPAGGGSRICDVVRRRRWDLFPPVEVVCSQPMFAPSVHVVVRLGTTTVTRDYDACTSGQVEAWRDVLGLDRPV